MIDAIQTHLIDLLAGSPMLFAEGSAWAQGWLGVRRIDAGQPASAGFVNLYDTCYDRDSSESRPAVYVGTKGVETVDRLDTAVCAGQGRMEMRAAVVPLIVVASAYADMPTPDTCTRDEAAQLVASLRLQARQQRNQLMENVKSILYPRYAEEGFWYLLSAPGESGGGQARITTAISASGNGDQAVVEAIGTLPFLIKYSWMAGSRA